MSEICQENASYMYGTCSQSSHISIQWMRKGENRSMMPAKNRSEDTLIEWRHIYCHLEEHLTISRKLWSNKEEMRFVNYFLGWMIMIFWKDEDDGAIGPMDKIVHSLTDTESKRIEKKVARFFYATSTSFNKVGHPTFKEMAQSMRKPYEPPSRKRLSGKLLTDEYTEVTIIAKCNWINPLAFRQHRVTKDDYQMHQVSHLLLMVGKTVTNNPS